MPAPKHRRDRPVSNRTPAPRLAPVIHGQGVEETTATHEALKSKPFWPNLRLDGYGAAGDGQLIEHRRCPQCGGTLSKLVPAEVAMRGLRDASGVVTQSLGALSPRMSTDGSNT